MTPNTTSTPPAASVRFSHWCRLPSALVDHHLGYLTNIAAGAVQRVVDIPPSHLQPGPAGGTDE